MARQTTTPAPTARPTPAPTDALTAWCSNVQAAFDTLQNAHARLSALASTMPPGGARRFETLLSLWQSITRDAVPGDPATHRISRALGTGLEVQAAGISIAARQLLQGLLGELSTSLEAVDDSVGYWSRETLPPGVVQEWLGPPRVYVVPRHMLPDGHPLAGPLPVDDLVEHAGQRFLILGPVEQSIFSAAQIAEATRARRREQVERQERARREREQVEQQRAPRLTPDEVRDQRIGALEQELEDLRRDRDAATV